MKLSRTSKMPGHSYSLPAHACLTGSVLRTMKNSICSHCYARKGRYTFPNVMAPREENLREVATTDPDTWVENLVQAIDKTGDEYFRWHDSGDLQGLSHLHNICGVARSLKDVKFYLPTKEHVFCDRYIALNGLEKMPENLAIRYSAHYLEGLPARPDRLVNGVTDGKDGMDPNVPACPATFYKKTHGATCGDCRLCWDPSVPAVWYKLG